jgi:N-acetylmuramoyl-L-alanine amidase
MNRRPGPPVPSTRPRSSIALLSISISISAVLATALTGCSAGGTPAAAPQTPVAANAAVNAGATSAGATASASATQSIGTSSTAASPSAVASSSAANTLAGKVVVIDPGHNGGNAADPAAVNALVPMGFGQYKACDTTGTEASDGYTEHAFNWDVAQRLDALLTARGIKVILTRSNDTGVGPCVNIRAAIGNNAHADAAISIHGDGYDGNGHGFQIIRASQSAGGSGNDTASNQFGQDLHASMLSESGFTPANYIGADGYESRTDLAGLNLSTVPKILVECGNMHDPGDLSRMESADGRQRIAQSLADGIIAFLNGH